LLLGRFLAGRLVGQLDVLRAVADLAVAVFVDAVARLPPPEPGHGRGDIQRHVAEPVDFVAMEVSRDDALDVVAVQQGDPLRADFLRPAGVHLVVVEVIDAGRVVEDEHGHVAGLVEGCLQPGQRIVAGLGEALGQRLGVDEDEPHAVVVGRVRQRAEGVLPGLGVGFEILPRPEVVIARQEMHRLFIAVKMRFGAGADFVFVDLIAEHIARDDHAADRQGQVVDGLADGLVAFDVAVFFARAEMRVGHLDEIEMHVRLRCRRPGRRGRLPAAPLDTQPHAKPGQDHHSHHDYPTIHELLAFFRGR